jgi:hypothetical protein
MIFADPAATVTDSACIRHRVPEHHLGSFLESKNNYRACATAWPGPVHRAILSQRPVLALGSSAGLRLESIGVDDALEIAEQTEV